MNDRAAVAPEQAATVLANAAFDAALHAYLSTQRHYTAEETRVKRFIGARKNEALVARRKTEGKKTFAPFFAAVEQVR